MSKRPNQTSSPPSSSSELNPSSLGLHNKTSRRQNRQSLTTSWIAAQEEQQLQSAASSNAHVQSEFVTPTITLTQPGEVESSEEVSKVLVPGLRRQSERGARRTLSTSSPSPPLKTSSQESRKHSGWHSRLSSTVIVDEPIPEEDEEEREGKVTKDESLLPPSASPQSSGSGWSRARAKSYPPSQHSATQTMLQLPRPEPVVVEEAGDDGSEVEDKSSGGKQPPSAVFKFVQMAVMAKKWKMRSNTEENKTSSQNSREMLLTWQKRRPLVEMPHVLKLEILEEAHHIVHKTLQMYRSELGLRHKLTLQAEQHCDTLAQQLNPSHSAN